MEKLQKLDQINSDSSHASILPHSLSKSLSPHLTLLFLSPHVSTHSHTHTHMHIHTTRIRTFFYIITFIKIRHLTLIQQPLPVIQLVFQFLQCPQYCPLEHSGSKHGSGITFRSPFNLDWSFWLSWSSHQRCSRVQSWWHRKEFSLFSTFFGVSVAFAVNLGGCYPDLPEPIS